MASSEELLTIRLRLQAARQFIADAVGAAASVASIGVAAEETAAKTKLASIESRVLQQGLYSLRRYAFYGTTAVLGAGAAALKMGLNFDEAKSQGTQAFGAILGDARLANREMTTLVALTHASGVGLGTLTGEAEQMQGFGFSIRQVNSYLSDLANYAERTGRGSGGLLALVDVFDRIRQRGKLTSLDLRSLTSQGVPALQILARQLHLTAAQAALLQAGKLVIPARYALPALAGGIGARARQLGPNLGQEVGITHSYLSSLLGGGEGGIFNFATRGLVHLNKAFAAASNGGGARAFFLSLDPSGKLLADWQIFTGDVRALYGAVMNLWRGIRFFLPVLGLLLAPLGLIARQTWLVRVALTALAYWYFITRARMILFAVATRAVSAAQTAYILILYGLDAAEAAAAEGMWLLNLAMDANPVGALIVGVATLAAGLYLLAQRFDWARDASDWLRKPLFHWSDLNPFKHGLGFHVPGLASGGTALTGGWAMVGEHGPELRYMPRGASVVPLDRAPGATLNGPIVIEVHMDGEVAARAVVATPIRRRTLAEGVSAARQLVEAAT